MDQTFMKTKPVLPLLLSMSLPMVLSMMVNSLYNIVDSFYVAQISEDAMNALSLVYPVQNLINAVTIGFSIGINAAIAYYLGAKKNKEADMAATQGTVLNAVHGVVLTVLCISIMPVFLKMFTDDSVVIDLGLRYSNIAFAFSVVIALGMSFEKLYQSVGRMTLTMISMLCGCIANIILDPVLIFGIGIFPELGIEGAAIATGIGQTISLIIYIIVYIRKPMNVHLDKKYLKVSKAMCKRLYVVGIPAALNLALPSLMISALNIILSAYSQMYVVVLGVYYKLQTFLYLPANGIVQGMRPLVGYNFGAGEHKRVRKIYNTAVLLALVIMTAGTLLCWLIPEQLFGLFSSNAGTVSAGAEALRIISIGFVVSTVSVISSGALEGLSMGAASLVISLLRYAVLTIPAAFILSLILGAVGVWHAFWISELITAVISYFLYKRKTGRIQQQDTL